MDDLINLDVFAEGLLKRFWKSHRSKAPANVYHYTSAEGLYGILTSNSIWASDCRFLNDASESQVGITKAQELCRQRRFSGPSSQYEREFYKEIGAYLRITTPDPNFVFSLSEREDDLTQWRTYANDGQGFTIGLSAPKLLENSQDNNGEFEFSKVIYSSRVQDQLIRQVFDQFDQYIDAVQDADKDNVAMTLDWLIGNFSTLFKHSSFISEKEWRVNTYNLVDEESEKVRVRASCGRLVPYIPLNLGKFPQDPLPITRIGIGPSFKEPTVKYAVEKLCKQTGFDVEIYSADSPYRRI